MSAPKGNKNRQIGDTKRSNQLQIKVTPEFKELLKSKAKKEGLSTSQFVIMNIENLL
jgi:uncharacterized protein (DUF1778 family)